MTRRFSFGRLHLWAHRTRHPWHLSGWRDATGWAAVFTTPYGQLIGLYADR